MQIFDDSGFHPSILHSTVNASSIYRLVENNFGISIVPTSLQSGYDLDIKFIELGAIPQRTTLKIVWNNTNANPILKIFLAVVNHFVKFDQNIR
jgi:DNA-binding transcriptional LysR family regulator